MKQRTLVMIRHAKSSWANASTTDFDRPLNERGEQDAPAMGERLKKLGITPGLIISSTAKRARQTARKIAGTLNYDKDKIEYIDKLYHCVPSVFEEVIYGIDDNIDTVFIVAHNPGITMFVNQLSPSFTIVNMPTCGIVATHINTKHWNEFSAAEKNVYLFESPKQQS